MDSIVLILAGHNITFAKGVFRSWTDCIICMCWGCPLLVLLPDHYLSATNTTTTQAMPSLFAHCPQQKISLILV